MLSERLRRLHNAVAPGARVADIGCDHARLAIALRRSMRAACVIASDVAPGPLRHARLNIAHANIDGIDLRLGFGLDTLKQNEVDTIVIAGMGAMQMAEILERGKAVLAGVKQLILQPAAEAEPLRCWFLRNGWGIDSEDMFEDGGFYYELLTIVPGGARRAYHLNKLSVELQCVFGPHLVKQNSEVFRTRWRTALPGLENIVADMYRSRDPRTMRKRLHFERRVAFLREFLA